MEAEERGGGSRDEDTKLVDSAVRWVKIAVGWKRGFGQGKEECRCHAEVNSIFGDIDKEEGDHTGVQSSACLKGMAGGRINWEKRLLAGQSQGKCCSLREKETTGPPKIPQKESLPGLWVFSPRTWRRG